MSLPDLEDPPVALEPAGVLHAEEAVVLVDEPASAHHHVTTGRWIDGVDHRVKRARLEGVIGVDEPEDLSRRDPEALVDRIRLPAIGLANHFEVRIARQHVDRGIRRHPVDDDVFDVGIVLRLDALDGAADEVALVVRAGDD